MQREKKRLLKSKKISSLSGWFMVVLLIAFLFYTIYSVTRLMAWLEDIRQHPIQVLSAGAELQNDIDNVRLSF